MNTTVALPAYALIRSLAPRSASHSSSAGGRLNRLAASVAPGSIRIRVSPHSTYVATERTPSESAASGTTFTPAPPQPLPAAEKGAAARRRPRAAREAYSLYVERAAEGANEADAHLSAAGS